METNTIVGIVIAVVTSFVANVLYTKYTNAKED
jgi:biopolymer transport protein ExbB/TolQ